MSPYFALGLAIVAEVAATSALKASARFTEPGPSVIVILGYLLAFYLMSIVIESIPVGITYAVWSGLGIVLVTLVAVPLYRQVPDLPALLGMGLIIAGVLVINLFSRSSHG